MLPAYTYRTPRDDLAKGCVYITLAFFCLAVFGLLTREAAQAASKIWISWITYATAFMLLLRFTMADDTNAFKKEHFSWLVGRALFGLAATFCYMLALQDTTFVNATVLFNTAPLFLPLLTASWLHSAISIKTWLALLLGFIGIAVVVSSSPFIVEQPGNLWGLAAGFCLAIAFLFVKRLAAIDSNASINLYFFGIATLAQLPLLFFYGPVPSSQAIGLAISAGVALLLAHVFLVAAYRYGDVAQFGAFQYTMVFFVASFDWLLWNQLPTFYAACGACFVILAGIIVSRSGVIRQFCPAVVRR